MAVFGMKCILFVPASRGDLVTKATASAAPIVCLDLEDGVAPAAKPLARDALPKAMTELRAAGKGVAVRLNSELEYVSLDLTALSTLPDYIVVPKAGSTRFLIALEAALLRLHNTVPALIALIESAADLHALRSEADLLPDSIIALCLGTEDFAADLGVAADSDPIAQAFVELGQIAARRRVALVGYPGSIAEFRDLERFRRDVLRGRAGGSVGGFAIHPAQLAVLSDAFTLPESERKACNRIVIAFEAAVAQGKGAISLDGRMIDRPVYFAARRSLKLA